MNCTHPKVFGLRCSWCSFVEVPSLREQWEAQYKGLPAPLPSAIPPRPHRIVPPPDYPPLHSPPKVKKPTPPEPEIFYRGFSFSVADKVIIAVSALVVLAGIVYSLVKHLLLTR